MDCSFCGSRIEKGTGTIFVTKKGNAVYFCSRKCEKNLLKLKRKPRKVKWTKDYRVEKNVRIKSAPMSKVQEESVETREEKEVEKPEKKKSKKVTKKKTKSEKAKSKE